MAESEKLEIVLKSIFEMTDEELDEYIKETKKSAAVQLLTHIIKQAKLKQLQEEVKKRNE